MDSPTASVASWYTPGRSDGFGDRLLMFDNTDAISLELLRFRRDLAATPGFEDALRDRVDHLAQFRHPSFPLIRAVVHLDDEELTLVSAHAAGQRLSELATGKLRKGLHPAVVTWIIREITPALAEFQATAPGVAHGALNADRIVLTSDGRLCIVEHALGAAIRRLGLTSSVMWRQFGLLAPVDDRGIARIDPRTDVVQLGTIALSLLLARPVVLHDFERRLPALLDEFSALADVSPSVFAEPLRAWLERALQLAPRSYRSAKDAQEGLDELPEASGPAGALGAAALQLPSAPDATTSEDNHLGRLVSIAQNAGQRPLRPHAGRSIAPDPTPEAVPAPQIAPTVAPPSTAAIPERRRWKRAYTVAIGIVLGAIVLAQGAVIVRLGTQPSVVTIAPPALTAPPPQQPPAVPDDAVGTTPVTEIPKPAVVDTAAAALAQAAARQRSGGLRITSPIELNVFEDDRVLGSTADGPIVAAAGIHQIDLVNTALGYRSHQTVTIKAGVITPVALSLPMGRLNINAQPWAQVLIDDSPVGETPLANVSVPLGQHQITFRHPQLGERRETVTVRADTIGRVSVSFGR